MSDAEQVKRMAHESEGLPTLWDLEMPLDEKHLSLRNFWHNRTFLDEWLRQRAEPIHIWRGYRTMGLNPLFLRLIAMHYDPLKYPILSLHLDFYTKGSGKSPEALAKMLRCCVERYGDRFIPAFGVLNDGEGAADDFVQPETLRQNLHLAREAGVAEIWLFGVNGLNEDYLEALYDTIPLKPFSTPEISP